MVKLFYGVIDMSIAASWLIMAIIVLRIFLKRLPRKITCFLWALVAIRLVCPLAVESPFSLVPDMQGRVLGYADTSDNTIQDSYDVKLPDYTGNSAKDMSGYTDNVSVTQNTDSENSQNNIKNDMNISDSSDIFQNDAGNEDINADAGRNGKSLKNITDIVFNVKLSNGLIKNIVPIWVGGAVLMLVYASVSYILIRRRTGISVNIEKNIYICDDIATPFVLGTFVPKIYLPSSLTDSQKVYVIAHENAHLKRLDNIWKPLGYIILSVYWFNPFVWAAYILLCRDIEIACDEKVVADKDMEYKKQYAMTLLSCSAPGKVVSACPLAFGETGVKTRIKTVLNYRKPAFWLVIVAAVACIVVVVCFMTSPRSNVKNDENRTDSEYVSEPDSEGSSSAALEPAGTDIDYEGWHIEYEAQQGWEGSIQDNVLTITNTDDLRSVNLVPYDLSESLVSYSLLKGIHQLSLWEIEGLKGTLGSYFEFYGGIAKSVYKIYDGTDKEGDYGFVVIYSVDDNQTAWYIRFSAGYTLDEIDAVTNGIDISLAQSEGDKKIIYYDEKLPLSVYEQFELSQDRISFLNLVLTDDEGNVTFYDGHYKKVFDLLATELENDNPELYEKLKNPVSSAQALLGINYASYVVYSNNIYGGRYQQVIEFTLEDGNKRAIEMDCNGTLGLWCPYFEYDIDSLGYQNMILEDEYMAAVTADRLEQVTQVWSNVSEMGDAVFDVSDEYVILDSVPDKDIVLYGMYGGNAMVIRDGKHVIPVWISWMSPHMVMPKIYYGDYDNDGIYEYAIWSNMNTGSGVSGQELYIVEADYTKENIGDDFYSIKEYSDWGNDLNNAVDYYLDAAGNIITVTLYGEMAASIDLSEHFEEHKEYNESFDYIDFGSQYSFTEQDGIWYFVNAGRIYVKRDGIKVYDADRVPYNVVVSARVVYEQNQQFHLEDIAITVE